MRRELPRAGSHTPKVVNNGWGTARAQSTAITGGTESPLVLRTAQRGKKITVKVKAVRTGHSNGYAVSKPTGAVARRPQALFLLLPHREPPAGHPLSRVTGRRRHRGSGGRCRGMFGRVDGESG
ncbi:hypothetical protein V1460_35225 [Streptomyces sp. SCSIO 30461]|uniref:hypothetical protein n=1 Tax=Streptomyces sp. SCSIO 30461 TaxID=3118085 RepID=UPI0030D51787